MTAHTADLDLPRVSARYSLEILSGEEIKALATKLVEAGRWTPAIDEAHTSSYPVVSELGPHLETMLGDEGISVPTQEQAVWMLLRSYLREVARGSLLPRKGMQIIMDEIYGCRIPAVNRKYVGDSHGIESLVGLYYSYDDLEERPDEVSCDGQYGTAAIEALGKHIVKEAGEWLEAHGDKKASL